MWRVAPLELALDEQHIRLEFPVAAGTSQVVGESQNPGDCPRIHIPGNYLLSDTLGQLMTDLAARSRELFSLSDSDCLREVAASSDWSSLISRFTCSSMYDRTQSSNRASCRNFACAFAVWVLADVCPRSRKDRRGIRLTTS